jgi:hypothetical protein
MPFSLVLMSQTELIHSSTQYDIVNGNEDQLDNVPDEANHDEAHRASLQNFHVLYSQKR